MSNQFTVFGLQRSGTNFLEQLIKNSVNNVGCLNTWSRHIWKHAYNIESHPRNTKKAKLNTHKIIYIKKHPYSWIESICDKHVDIKKTYEHVTNTNTNKDTQQWMHKGLNLVELAKLWNDHTSYWIDQRTKQNIYSLKYEDLILSEDQTRFQLKKICEHFNWTHNKPINIPKKVSQSDQFNDNKRERYKNIKLISLSFEQILEINKHISNQTLEPFNYDLIETIEEYNKHK